MASKCTAAVFVEQSGNCDAHFTWLKKISIGGESLIDIMQKPIGGTQYFSNSDDAQTWLLSWLVAGILITGSLIARMGLNRARSSGGTLQFVPDGSMTARNFFELFTGALYALAYDLLGHENAKKFKLPKSVPLCIKLCIWTITFIFRS